MNSSSLSHKTLQSAYQSAFDGYPFIALNHLLVGLLCCVFAQVLFDSSIKAIVWYLSLACVLALRFFYIRHLSSKITKTASSRSTFVCYTLSSSAIGFVWAVGAILTLQTEQADAQLPVVLISSGLAFGGIIYHINFRPAFHSYFWALMGPISLYLIVGQQQYLAGATIIITGLIYLFFYAGKLHLRSIRWIQETVERETLITELSIANDKIKRMSETDALTGVHNRTFFNHYLSKIWAQAIEKEQYLCVVLLDIDFFKPYNDNYGHIAGDEALKQVVKILKSVTPPSATTTLSRVGGEEFLALIPCCDSFQAANYADELRTAVEEAKIPHAYSTCCEYVTISVGVSGKVPQTGDKAVELIDVADGALYKAKKAGRNFVALAD